jgi:YHS domain-containing protein
LQKTAIERPPPHNSLRPLAETAKEGLWFLICDWPVFRILQGAITIVNTKRTKSPLALRERVAVMAVFSLNRIVPLKGKTPMRWRFVIRFGLPALLAAVLSGCGGANTVKETKSDSAGKDAVAAKDSDKTADDLPGLKELDEADRKLAVIQKVCPKTGEPLGSMGKPFKIKLNGREFFLCCEGCEAEVRKDPETYLKKVDALLAKK